MHRSTAASQLERCVHIDDTRVPPEYEQERLRESAALEISVNVSPGHRPTTTATARQIVLQRCNQRDPLKFTKWYSSKLLRNCQKIGEGVYGEVFLYRNPDVGGTTVMKVIPIEGTTPVNGERQKRFDEILSEIVIASELSKLRHGSRNRTSGFNELQRVRCVRGRYPERLVELWELYEESKGTANDNPSLFGKNQTFVVLELTHAGNDLESFIFSNYTEVYHVFLQIAISLAVAEEELQFEHRDLHWGNVLVKRVAKNALCHYTLCGQPIIVPTFSVEASIIDFTLSRITYDDISCYNDLSQDPDLFNAEGGYQFEIYKLMQIANDNNWKDFQPRSNVLWLHYVLEKLTTDMRLARKTAVGKDLQRTLLNWFDCIMNYKSSKHFVDAIILPHLKQYANYIV